MLRFNERLNALEGVPIGSCITIWDMYFDVKGCVWFAKNIFVG